MRSRGTPLGDRSCRAATLLSALLPILVLATACRPSRDSSDAPAAAEPPSVRAVSLPISADIRGVNELLAGGSQVFADVVRRSLFASLFEEQADYAEHPPTFRPYLAETWEWSDDRKVLDIQLRDARWSDGHPITAEDVRFTWQAQTHPDVAWDTAYAKESIADIEVLNARSVRVRFKTLTLNPLADLNEGAILPRHVWSALPFAQWREQPTWFEEHLVTSGPFLLKRRTPQQEIVVERNPDFFLTGQPKLDRVVFRVIPDRESQLVQLLAGELDYVEALTVREAERVRASSRVRVADYWSRQYNYLAWNLRRAPFAEREIRRALAEATDRSALLEALAPGLYRVASSPIPSTVWAHDPTLRPWPHDPASARRRLEAAGFRDRDGDGILERDGKPFRFEIATNASSPIRVDAATLLAEQLRRVGIDARPAAIDFSLLVDRMTRGEFDAAISAWAVDTSLDISHAFETGAAYNWGAYSSPALDELLREFRAATDTETARSILWRSQQLLHGEQPYLFLWEVRRLDAIASDIQNAGPNSLSPFFNLREWSIAERP